MRHNSIYSVLHLSTLTFFTAATPPEWTKAQSKTFLSFDLNKVPVEEIPPESCSSSHEQIASSLAMGLRDPNPTAGVQSASSHGRDHSGHSLGQPSSSCRFTSATPGKRKTSDSSAGSTSQRYKKGNTSDRHEAYNLVNQHFSLKNSASDMIPTSSTPGYVLATQKNPTSNAIGKFKEKELAGCTGVETNKKEQTLFNVYDWKYLREYPESEKSEDQQHRFLRHLNQCKSASDIESFFFIERDGVNGFLNRFVSRKNQFEFNLPLGIDKQVRLGVIFKTLLRLSDKKINLEGYPGFKRQFIGGMRRRLAKNFNNTQNPSSKPKIRTMLRFVQNITKVTQLLMVVQLSLFKENDQEFLKAEEVEKHLKFLQELWFQIDEGTADMQERDWAMRAHQLFKFQAHERYVDVWMSRKDKNYHFCWNIVNYWREKTGRSLRGLDRPDVFPRTLQELVNKIVFFSNPESQPPSFPKKKPRISRGETKIKRKRKN